MSATWLVDTNTLIHAVRGRPPRVRDELRRRAPSDIAVSAVTIAELWYGAEKHPNPSAKRDAWAAVLEPYEVLAFDRAAAEHHARLRHALRHTPIGERDLLIAAIATANRLIVVTQNTREFGRVPDLVIQDWTQAKPGPTLGLNR
jgi:tRNA(fMet)-specific endonuclease VapC